HCTILIHSVSLNATATAPISALSLHDALPISGPAFSHGAYVAVVEIERETGEVRIRSIAAADDCGRVVNPLLSEGQVVGATVQADRKSTRLNSSHVKISYAVFCLKKKKLSN